MTDETRRPRPAAQYGPTAAAVAANVRRVRELRGLTIYGLASALSAVNRPIAPSAVAKIERKERQVTVDDLTALAVVLGVSPSALLLPLTDRTDDSVEVTGGGSVAADTAWDWADGKRPLRMSGDIGAARLEYELYGRPPGRRGRLPRTDRPADVADVLEWLRERGVEPPGGTDG